MPLFWSVSLAVAVDTSFYMRYLPKDQWANIIAQFQSSDLSVYYARHKEEEENLKEFLEFFLELGLSKLDDYAGLSQDILDRLDEAYARYTHEFECKEDFIDHVFGLGGAALDQLDSALLDLEKEFDLTHEN
jgi:hypothetical protein